MKSKRIQKLQAEMAKKGFDALIVTSEINQRYLTGFAYTDGYVLVTTGKCYLLTDFRYIEAAKATVDASLFDILMPKGGMLDEMAAKMADSDHPHSSVSVAFQPFQAFRQYILHSSPSFRLNDFRCF